MPRQYYIYTTMKRIASNSKILDLLIEQSGCENPNQYAAYLTEKYGINITRQQVKQFQNSESLTITHLLLREAMENKI